MYPKVVPIPGNIELVQNSGIQFIDFDVMLDWNIDDKHNILKLLEKGKFYNKDNQLGFLAPNYPVSGNQIEFEDVNPDEDGNSVKADECNLSYKLSDSLKLFDGAWFPLPFFVMNVLRITLALLTGCVLVLLRSMILLLLVSIVKSTKSL